MQQTADLVGLTEAARQLDCHRATLDRWLKDRPALNHGKPGRPRVDVGELRAYRDGLDPDKTAAGTLGGARANGESSELAGLRAEKLREEIEIARQKRLERDGELLPKDLVEAAFFECGRRVRRKIELIEIWADELATAAGGDAAALRAALKDKLRGFEAEIAETVARIPGADEEEADPAQERGDRHEAAAA